MNGTFGASSSSFNASVALKFGMRLSEMTTCHVRW
jgi:hypothetical protein